MKQIALQFGLLTLAFFALLQLTKYTLFTQRLAHEGWTVLFALVFLALGFWLYQRFGPAKIIEMPSEALVGMKNIDAEELEKRQKKLGISKREYEVLTLIAEGLSNQQIAEQLYISESTVKSHVSNLLIKLEAQRRTQAVSEAQKKGIL